MKRFITYFLPIICMDIITKQNTRVFMPTEYELLRSAMVSEQDQERITELIEKGNIAKANYIQRYQIVCDALLLSGMRPIEFERMERSWYRAPRRCIVLPKGACKKEKCEYTERTIMLSLPGCDAIDRYLNSGIAKMGKVTMRDTLRRYAIRAGIGETGVTSKAFRKTLVSWLLACFEEKQASIAASMGHDIETIRKNYWGLGFPMKEIELMKTKYLVEWGMRL
jgi:integrase